MTAPNVKVLIGEVAKRHGITLKPDDPAFALVTLNQLVLEQAMNGLNEQARNAAREFAEGLSRLQDQTGGILGTEVRNVASQIRQAVEAGGSAQTAGGRPPAPVPAVLVIRWLATGVVVGLILFVLGVFVGRFWR